jgi:hypothetical protein
MRSPTSDSFEGRRDEDGSESEAWGRVAVIGDVAGHVEELQAELRRLGADGPSDRLPPDLTVIQVGDLVHRGPSSDDVVALVDRYLSDQPDQWIQLVGNHEAHYLHRPLFDWSESISARSVDTLRRWWATGQMRAAATVRAHAEDFLITHAGLTAGFWREVLDGETDAGRAAAALNGLIGPRDGVLFRAGHMIRGRKGNHAAGPTWAASGTELVPSWLPGTLPFSQIHGHTSIIDWPDGRARASEEIARRTITDAAAKHTTVVLEGGRIVGIDPGHGRDAQRPWRAWETRAWSIS